MENEIREVEDGMQQVNNANDLPPKSKGGRPKGKQRYLNFKLTLYLSEDEYRQFMEFSEKAWYDHNLSRSARFLLLHTLEDWERKGKRKVGFGGEYK